jgi:hypothetical protein
LTAWFEISLCVENIIFVDHEEKTTSKKHLKPKLTLFQARTLKNPYLSKKTCTYHAVKNRKLNFHPFLKSPPKYQLFKNVPKKNKTHTERKKPLIKPFNSALTYWMGKENILYD